MKTACLSLLFAGAMAISLAPAAAQPALPPGLVQSCEACHGKGGDSQRADVPRLNGQQRDYIFARLRQFLDPTQGTPHSNQMMWQNAMRVSDAQAGALADYFSRQAPTPAAGTLSNSGAATFRQPLSSGAPSCASCHGDQGEGEGGIPRLAGQHGEYLVSQLEAFMLTARVATPMNHHTWAMTPEQMKAVSQYLSND